MPENHATYQDRLKSLRLEIAKEGLDGFILPRTDEFQGEFLAPYAERLAWLSGFTGSAGVGIVTMESAVVMSDGRYTLQLEQQVPQDLYETANSVETSVGTWLSENMKDKQRVGYDALLHTAGQVEKMTEAIEGTGIQLVSSVGHLVDRIWHDQPARPSNPISVFPNDIAGRTSYEKRLLITEKMKEKSCDACLITVGDSIAWLLNIRGNDIAYSPLCLSYALLHADASIEWFVEPEAVSENIEDHIGEGLKVYSFEKLEERLSQVTGRVWLDQMSAPIWFSQLLERNDIETYNAKDPCVTPKACKTQSEQEAIKHAHIIDGVAVTKFLYWLDKNANTINMSEVSVEEKLEAFRSESPEYLEPSFPTIAGFAEHGAIVHYRAMPETSKEIVGDSLLLVDSGGQYKWGTTDITRTIAIGEPTQEMREHYTRVLKGHIAVARARFKQGTVGKDVDALARAPLQDVGLDYAHGTGHGVGCYLCVHEEAANISPRGEIAFDEGMLISNEPGYYKDHAYGIRIENLVLVKQDDDMLCFETITLAPYDNALICKDMLNEEEVGWLIAYQNKVYDLLKEYLDVSEKEWLKHKARS